MKKTKKLVVGNWKLYIDTPKAAKALWKSVSTTARKTRKTDVVVCPPMPLLGLFAGNISGRVSLGAQDVFWTLEPKWTGQTSVYALRSLGVGHVIVGHSEVRALGESNEAVAMKVGLLLKTGLTPIVCVGERERDDKGQYLSHLEAQIRASLAGVSRQKASKLVIAYEPLWAIGRSADDALPPEHLHQMTLFIKKTLVSLYGRNIGTTIPILYGGSVESKNVAELVAGGEVDGVLVGHASVDAKEFSAIIRSVDDIKDVRK